MLRKTQLLLIVFTVSGIFSFAQNFGGVINFKKQVGTVTTEYVYYVKGDRVRFDEYKPGTKILSESFILNVKTDSMVFLDPDRKLYGERVRQTQGIAEAGCVVTTATEKKSILNYSCSEQTVKNIGENTSIDFFIAPGKFSFFMPMVKLINSHEKFSTYFLAMTVEDGAMPLLAVESDLTGVEKERLEVTSIEEKVVEEKLFRIPKGYSVVK